MTTVLLAGDIHGDLPHASFLMTTAERLPAQSGHTTGTSTTPPSHTPHEMNDDHRWTGSRRRRKGWHRMTESGTADWVRPPVTDGWLDAYYESTDDA